MSNFKGYTLRPAHFISMYWTSVLFEKQINCGWLRPCVPFLNPDRWFLSVLSIKTILGKQTFTSYLFLQQAAKECKKNQYTSLTKQELVIFSELPRVFKQMESQWISFVYISKCKWKKAFIQFTDTSSLKIHQCICSKFNLIFHFKMLFTPVCTTHASFGRLDQILYFSEPPAQ